VLNDARVNPCRYVRRGLQKAITLNKGGTGSKTTGKIPDRKEKTEQWA
jgi:hypothetical protein